MAQDSAEARSRSRSLSQSRQGFPDTTALAKASTNEAAAVAAPANDSDAAEQHRVQSPQRMQQKNSESTLPQQQQQQSWRNTVSVGCKLNVLYATEKEWRRAEVLAMQGERYYVHYLDYNKRLDEWVPYENLDLSNIEQPKVKRTKTSGQNTTVSKGGSQDKKSDPLSPPPKKTSTSSNKAVKSPSPLLESFRTPQRGQKVTSPVNPSLSFASIPEDHALHETKKRSQPDNDISIDNPAGFSSFADTSAGSIAPAASSAVDLDAEVEAEVDTDPDAERERIRRGGSMTQCVSEIARVKNLSRIVMGAHIIEPWYFSPYPVEFSCGYVPPNQDPVPSQPPVAPQNSDLKSSGLGSGTVYICEFCLSYFGSNMQHERHRTKCQLRHPPGNEIYRHNDLSFFEVDGKLQKTYCRNLCLLSKCFLDHKTLYYDADPFLFYILTTLDPTTVYQDTTTAPNSQSNASATASPSSTKSPANASHSKSDTSVILHLKRSQHPANQEITPKASNTKENSLTNGDQNLANKGSTIVTLQREKFNNNGIIRPKTTGCRIVGYFSKEKESADGFNVACILTLPQHQRKGYGRILIQFSYELSKLEGRVGSPEKPLSDLGLLGYRAYWSEVIIEQVLQLSRRGEVSLEELSMRTSITVADITHTLQALNALCYYRGQHVICLSESTVERHEAVKRRKGRVSIVPEKIDWRPPVFGSLGRDRYV